MSSNLSTLSPPPKTPNPVGTSYKEALLNKERDLNQSYRQIEEIQMADAENLDEPITLSKEDKGRI